MTEISQFEVDLKSIYFQIGSSHILRYLLTELFHSVTAYIIVPLCGVSYVIDMYVCIMYQVRSQVDVGSNCNKTGDSQV